LPFSLPIECSQGLQSVSSEYFVQAFLPLLDQPLGGRNDFFGQEPD
jgi:hypothetical protein